MIIIVTLTNVLYEPFKSLFCQAGCTHHLFDLGFNLLRYSAAHDKVWRWAAKIFLFLKSSILINNFTQTRKYYFWFKKSRIGILQNMKNPPSHVRICRWRGCYVNHFSDRAYCRDAARTCDAAAATSCRCRKSYLNPALVVMTASEPFWGQ